jgi:hypothetical protein
VFCAISSRHCGRVVVGDVVEVVIVVGDVVEVVVVVGDVVEVVVVVGDVVVVEVVVVGAVVFALFVERGVPVPGILETSLQSAPAGHTSA